jgi:hypothetical protein
MKTKTNQVQRNSCTKPAAGQAEPKRLGDMLLFNRTKTPRLAGYKYDPDVIAQAKEIYSHRDYLMGKARRHAKSGNFEKAKYIARVLLSCENTLQYHDEPSEMSITRCRLLAMELIIMAQRK